MSSRDCPNRMAPSFACARFHSRSSVSVLTGARNDADTAKDHRLSRDQGIDAVLKAHKLDAILTPGGSGANLASRAGYPIVAVPFGMVPNAPTPVLPAGFDAKPAPFGVTFTASACAEPRLIALAYAFEQASKRRAPPPDMP